MYEAVKKASSHTMKSIHKINDQKMAIINAKLNENEDKDHGQSIYVDAKDSILSKFSNRKIIQISAS
jgi:hypothetical protein